jgi:ABC-type polysaccharide/polyol phosphate transport system ATPase subunit
LTRALRGRKPIQFTALDRLSLSIADGEAVGIIGRNGAGKSTLLRVIAQIIIPSGGEVRVRGRVTPLLELGIGFHPELSGRENCYLAGALLGFTPKQVTERMDRIREFSEIGAFLDSPVKTYSSGMYARLAFTLATEVEPEILLVDEILGVGDEFFQQKSLDRMQRLMKKGVTTVLVSHNMTFLAKQCTRVIWMDEGRIVDDGATEEVLDRYKACGGHPRPAGPGN